MNSHPPLPKRLFVADPIGFCNGVRRAMELFNHVTDSHPGEPIYVLHELVHNSTVTQDMKKRGAVFVTSLDDVPAGALTLFGAHGIGADVEADAQQRHLRTFNAVCPLVANLQQLVAKMPSDLPLIFYGDSHHPEVQSILNRAASKSVHLISTVQDIDVLPAFQKALFLSQTTRSADDVATAARMLREKVSELDDRSDICNAVRRRQKAIAALARTCEAVLIASSPHSANGQRMVSLAKDSGNLHVTMIESASDIHPQQFESIQSLALGAATSTPPAVIEHIIQRLLDLGFHRSTL